MKNPALRLTEKKWGVFTHYLYESICSPASPQNRGVGRIAWSDAVDMFDVERVAYSLHRMNAGYYFITVQQGTEFLIAPNETFNKIAETRAGECCATRDLPMELAHALEKYGIDLCLYYTGVGPCTNPLIGARFGYVCAEGDGTVTEDFCVKWGSVAAEYAERYGGLVKAWWIDGMYDHLGYDDRLRGIIHGAIKKANPTAAIACNNGVKPTLAKVYSGEEFICGEENEFRLMPEGDIHGAVPHILAPLGYDKAEFIDWNGWAKTGCRHTAEYMRDYIRAFNRHGGAVSVDVFTDITGSFDTEQELLLRWVGENL